MSESTPTPEDFPEISREDKHTFLFGRLVQQQAALAAMLLGREPHPETGQPVTDFGSAQLFIDQLEMIEAKTKGNLTEAEAKMLRQNLVALRMAFVEAVQSAQAPQPAAQPPIETPPTEPTAATPPPPEEEESKKKFTKKY